MQLDGAAAHALYTDSRQRMWRRLRALVRPEDDPFDSVTCVDKLRNLVFATSHPGHEPPWTQLVVSVLGMTCGHPTSGATVQTCFRGPLNPAGVVKLLIAIQYCQSKLETARPSLILARAKQTGAVFFSLWNI